MWHEHSKGGKGKWDLDIQTDGKIGRYIEIRIDR